MKKAKFTKLIKSFQFAELFNLLGWDIFNNQIPINLKEQEYQLVGIAQKRTFAILQCPHNNEGEIPKSNLRKQIERKLTKYYHEHLIIYTNKNQTQQIWQLVIKEPNLHNS